MKILPFRGYRYNPGLISSLDDVISPPYDQYKEGLVDLLYQRHPFNIARLIMNKETSLDNPSDNRYTRSKALLQEWIRQGVFLRDPRPAVYPYFQDYHLTGRGTLTRKGFVALGEVTPYAEKVVFPHERTLSKPKEDRLNLLRATLADTGLVYMLYSDPPGEIEQILDSATVQPPEMKALDLKGELNRLWRIDAEETLSQLSNVMKNRTVIIADGHHRYEVALSFREENRKRISDSARWDLYGYKLMSFVRLESEGVTIFPIHRLVHNVPDFDAQKLVKDLEEFFLLEKVCVTQDNKFPIADKLMASIASSQRTGENAFVLYVPAFNGMFRLSFRREKENALKWPSDKSTAWRQLDIAVLQEVVLCKMLGIGEQQLADQRNLEYVSEYQDAILTAERNKYQCAFLLNPTPIEHVKQVVEAGDILPQKSTHFHPKLMEGLVFAKHV